MEEREKGDIIVISSGEEANNAQIIPEVQEISSSPDISQIEDVKKETQDIPPKKVEQYVQNKPFSSDIPPLREENNNIKKTTSSDIPPVREEITEQFEAKKTNDIPISYDNFNKQMEDSESFEKQAKEIIYYKAGSDKIPEKVRQRERKDLTADNPWTKELNAQKEKKASLNGNNNLDDKKKNKIEYNKFSKFLIFITIAVTVMNLLLCLLQFFNPNFSNYMWTKVNYVIFDFLFKIMPSFGGIIPYINIILYSFGLVLIVFAIIIEFVFKNNIKKQSVFSNILIPFMFVFFIIINVNIYYYLSNTSHRGINEIYLKDNMNKQYTQEDLEKVIDHFKNRIVLYAESLNRKGDAIDVGNAYNIAVEDLRNLSVKYEFLKGEFPTKIRSISDYELKKTGYPLGLTINYTVGLDDTNLSELEKIFTLTHEFCHVKGVFRESDTNYCAFIAAFNSNNDISKYSMYTNLMPNLIYVSKNTELNDNIINEFGSICLDSGYDEICNLYSKDINTFIEGNDTIEFYTYSLDIYKKKKEELKQYFVGLKNRFNVSIKDEDGKELSLEDANKLIDKEEEVELHLMGSITKDKFNENTKYLNTVSDYFSNLYLSNSKEEDEDDNYDYLKQNPTGMFASITEKYPEFSYDRSIRSILEYFDKYVLN